MDEITASLISGVMGGLTLLILMPVYIKYALKRGWVGRDVHKPDKPIVAEMGGLVFVLSVLLSNSLLYVFHVITHKQFAVIVLVTLLAASIGIIDDLVTLNAISKVAAGLVLGAPILLFEAYKPSLDVPLIGSTRFTIIYPLAVPLAMTVFANAANMNDTHNGGLHLTTLFIYIAAGFAGAYKLVCGNKDGLALYLSLSYAFLSIAFLYFNFFPAKVFNGDTGSLTLGAMVGLIALLGKVEVAVVLAMMPWVIKGFGTIVSVRGFKEKSELEEKPVTISGWEIKATGAKKAPVTLVGLLTKEVSLTEPEIILGIVILSFLSSTVSIAVSLFTYAS